MVWAKLDDHFPEHRKVWPRTDAAFRLHVAGICHCSKLLTDGIIEHDRVQGLVPSFKRKALNELVEAGIWHTADHECEVCPVPPAGAYVIHDFLVLNPSREKVTSEREAAAERKRAWAEKKAKEKAAKNGVRDASRNGSRDGVRNAAPTRPDPARRALGRVSAGNASDEPITTDAEGVDTALSSEQVGLNVSAIRSIRGGLHGEREAS